MTADYYKVHPRSYKFCKTVVGEHTQETLMTSDFQKRTISQICFNGQDSERFCYLKNARHILEKQLKIAQDYQAVLTPNQHTWTCFGNCTPTHPLYISHSCEVYNSVRHGAIDFPSTSNVWKDIEIDKKACYASMVQMYTDETATILKANAVVAYPVHMTLPSFTKYFVAI